MPERTLDGVGVLVTRPEHQAAGLVAEIESRGGRAILFPSIEIVPRDPADVADDAANLSPPDMTIFISRNAVDHGIAYAAGELVAIGPATAAAIENAGHRVAVRPSAGFSSEHLLAAERLIDVAGKVIRIVRGNAGREKLAETLRDRGATVEYLSTYLRRPPDYADSQIQALVQRWQSGEIDACVVMSVESFSNLCGSIGNSCTDLLSRTVLVTPSARVLKEAFKLAAGFRAILSTGPQDGELADSLAIVRTLRPALTAKRMQS